MAHAIADTPGLTRALAGRAAAVQFDEIPGKVVEGARQALLDWFGVTISGSQEDATAILLRALPATGPDGVSVVGHDLRLPALHAALVNGTSSHRLDFDDVNTAFVGHCSVAIAGAVLALAEQLDSCGRDLLTAFVAGYETACRVAVAAGPAAYVRGWHSTGTNGTFGAAAACARLLGLDGATTAVALSLAASQAAGLKSNIGTMTKSLHAGKACENGLLAALLAAGDFTANPDAIEAEQGFAKLTADHCDRAAALADPPSGWYLRHNLFKYHASCYMTHSMLEGVGSLLTADPVGVADVQEVRVHISELERGACAIPAPQTGLEVKFSIAHLAAMALLRRTTNVIADADASDPELITTRSRVALIDDGVPGAPTRVEIIARDGRRREAAVDVNTPAADLSGQSQRLLAKFSALADPVIGPEAVGRLRELVATLERQPSIRPLLVAATPGYNLHI